MRALPIALANLQLIIGGQAAHVFHRDEDVAPRDVIEETSGDALQQARKQHVISIAHGSGQSGEGMKTIWLRRWNFPIGGRPALASEPGGPHGAKSHFIRGKQSILALTLNMLLKAKRCLARQQVMHKFLAQAVKDIHSIARGLRPIRAGKDAAAILRAKRRRVHALLGYKEGELGQGQINWICTRLEQGQRSSHIRLRQCRRELRSSS